ncbi:MAG: TatD family hydrolase [Flammeovirgaceae bacterium]
MSFFSENFIFWDIHTHQIPDGKKDEVKIFNVFPYKKDAVSPTQSSAYFSIGLHPWHIESNWQDDFANIQELAKLSNCLAIGECGLDRAINTPLEIQLSIFQKHILLSETAQKPLIIHCVRAYPDIISLHKKHKVKQKWILHAYQGNETLTKQILRYPNFLFSFGKGLWNPKVESIFKRLPLERCFLETDDSTLSVQEIYLKASTIRQIYLEELKQIIQVNVLNTLFKNV